MKPRLLREKYLTAAGAYKRAGFERGVAPGEYARGEKAHLYSYRVIFQDNCWRVERFLPAGVLASAASPVKPTA